MESQTGCRIKFKIADGAYVVFRVVKVITQFLYSDFVNSIANKKSVKFTGDEIRGFGPFKYLVDNAYSIKIAVLPKNIFVSSSCRTGRN